MIRMPRLPTNSGDAFVGAVVIGAGTVVGLVVAACFVVGFAQIVQWIGEW